MVGSSIEEIRFLGLLRLLILDGSSRAGSSMRMNLHGVPLTAHQAALLGLVQSYLSGMMDIGVSLLEIHKLMYFLQVAGEPLRLNYMPAPYGPHAENLRHILSNLASQYIHGYNEGGDNPRKPIELADGAGSEGRAILQDYPRTLERFGQVSRLIEGFESPFGMELLATVHWVADRQGAKTVAQAIEKVHSWIDRKTMFTPYQIQAAWDRFHRLGWLDGSTHADGHL